MTTTDNQPPLPEFDDAAAFNAHSVRAMLHAYGEACAAHALAHTRAARPAAPLSEPEIDSLLRDTIGFEGEDGELQELNRNDLHAVVRAALAASSAREGVK